MLREKVREAFPPPPPSPSSDAYVQSKTYKSLSYKRHKNIESDCPLFLTRKKKEESKLLADYISFPSFQLSIYKKYTECKVPKVKS